MSIVGSRHRRAVNSDHGCDRIWLPSSAAIWAYHCANIGGTRTLYPLPIRLAMRLNRYRGVSFEVIAFNERISFRLPKVLFTHRGLSGPAMLQLSNYWHVGEPIFINLFPSLDMAAFFSRAKKQHQTADQNRAK